MKKIVQQTASPHMPGFCLLIILSKTLVLFVLVFWQVFLAIEASFLSSLVLLLPRTLVSRASRASIQPCIIMGQRADQLESAKRLLGE